MFWLQIILPTVLASTGFAMLYADNRSQRAFVQRTFANTRVQIVELSERQIDKTEIKSRLEEIGQNQADSYGEFRYKQLMVAAIGALIPFIGLFLMIINLFQAISLAVFCGIGAYLVYDRHLSTLVQQRRDAIESEFPPIVEMLTLARCV